MKLEHVAIWTKNLEAMKDFYVKYFNGNPNEKYTDHTYFSSTFESYFLSFDSEARFEIMQMVDIPDSPYRLGEEHIGLTHFAFSLDTSSEVDTLTEQLRRDGFRIVSDPKRTGDNYYESCVLDPDGNRVEITTVPK